LVGPAIGCYLGIVVDRRWSTQPWGLAIGILVGLAASARVTIDLIRQANDLNRPDE